MYNFSKNFKKSNSLSLLKESGDSLKRFDALVTKTVSLRQNNDSHKNEPAL